MQRIVSPICFGLALLGLAASPAAAQGTATLESVVRVVKTARPGVDQFTAAKPSQVLSGGERVRTGGRSYAGVRFPDRSLLRVGELSEIVLTGSRQRESQVRKGKVLLNFTNPGTITGGYAVAAIRGTRVEYRADDDRRLASVRCYEGSVFVAAADNPVLAGSATALTPVTLASPAIEGEWDGGEVRFVAGPFTGQLRRITSSAAGSITFAPALEPAPAGGATGFVLSRRAGRRVVALRSGQGCVVHAGKEPDDPFGIPRQEFAFLEKDPWFEEESRNLRGYVGSVDHQADRSEDWPLTDLISLLIRDDPRCFGRPLPIPAAQRHRGNGRGGSGGGHCFRDELSRDLRGAGVAAMGSGPAHSPPRGTLGQGDNAVPGYFGSTGVTIDPTAFIRLSIQPIAVAAREDSALGGRVRLQATTGDFYADVGYRYIDLEGNSQGRISDALLYLKGRAGDLAVGRQHLFYGPANNHDMGTLLGLDASDAAIYRLPLRNGFRQEIGYVQDTNALRKKGEEGFLLRGAAPIAGGHVGYSTLAPLDRQRNVGASVDLSLPIAPNTLELYGEFGVNTLSRTIATAGLYFPGLYQRFKTDLYLEFASQQTREDRLTARLRREFGGGLVAYLFVDHTSASPTNYGAAVLWTLKLSGR